MRPTLALFALSMPLALGGCGSAPPPAPAATAAARDGALERAVQEPIQRAQAVEQQVLDAQRRQQDEIDAQTD